jgi:hypothetical protein
VAGVSEAVLAFVGCRAMLKSLKAILIHEYDSTEHIWKYDLLRLIEKGVLASSAGRLNANLVQIAEKS